MRRMLFCLFTFFCILLPGSPALAAASAAPVSPAPGDIVAEFVSCYYGQGSATCVFSEPDGNNFTILLCDDGENKDLCGEIGIYSSTFDPYDANAREQNLGRQFIITPEKILVEEKNGVPRIDWLRPSAIRLDTRPGIPRNTRVLPYQTLEGTVECVEEPMFQMYFIDTKKQRNVLYGKMGFGSAGPFSRMFCPNAPGYNGDGRLGPYRLQGDIVYKGIEPGVPEFEVVSPAWKNIRKATGKKCRPPIGRNTEYTSCSITSYTHFK
ncbi:hypothetical protein [Desulfovibrio cuneatus]|uniref:hypothetical protein n=1 Tax=Desulfovibrio cuneatus TaxID=159728 RepID=UPI00041D6EAA|nr:hypothetical protein [Desulfovibrio cuneatus]